MITSAISAPKIQQEEMGCDTVKEIPLENGPSKVLRLRDGGNDHEEPGCCQDISTSLVCVGCNTEDPERVLFPAKIQELDILLPAGLRAENIGDLKHITYQDLQECRNIYHQRKKQCEEWNIRCVEDLQYCKDQL